MAEKDRVHLIITTFLLLILHPMLEGSHRLFTYMQPVSSNWKKLPCLLYGMGTLPDISNKAEKISLGGTAAWGTTMLLRTWWLASLLLLQALFCLGKTALFVKQKDAGRAGGVARLYWRISWMSPEKTSSEHQYSLHCQQGFTGSEFRLIPI